ncbi:MAG TPA: molybdopterin-binding protein [Nitrososphaeraceae archaeon]|jgi:molybdenum cofactor synthesis domain-containing protein
MNNISEILCIGNELLLGTVQNTNAQWISKRIADAGGIITRVTIVRDNINEISSVVNEILVRDPDWLIISGGLGPTYDDLTLEGVAIALGTDLVLDEDAIEMLKRSYARYPSSPKLNEVRLKMARIPKGSIPIQNPVGSAPSILIDTSKFDSNSISTGSDSGKHTKIICLPGVPNELEAIFLDKILPQMKMMIGAFHIIETNHVIIGISEAMIAPTLIRIVRSFSDDSIYLKTHPRGFTKDSKPMLRIQIVAKGKDKSTVQSTYRYIYDTLIEEVGRLGGETLLT